MSHNIGKFDKQQGRRMAWHKLTDLKEGLALENCWLGEWDAREASPRNFVDSQSGKMLPLGDAKGDRRLYCMVNDVNEKGEPISIPLWLGPWYDPGTYKPFLNREFLALFAQVCAGAGWNTEIDSAGSVCDRSKTFISKEIGRFKDTSGREIILYLSALNSFDKSGLVEFVISAVCVVCDNTWRITSDIGGLEISHTPNCLSQDNLSRIPKLIARAVQTVDEFSGHWLRAESVPVTKGQAHGLFLAMLATGNDGASKVTARSAGVALELTEHFAHSPGANGVSLADVAQAITFYFSRFSASPEQTKAGDKQAIAKQIESSEFGTGMLRKKELWGVVNKLAASPELIGPMVDEGFAALRRGREIEEGRRIARAESKVQSGKAIGGSIKQLGEGRAS